MKKRQGALILLFTGFLLTGAACTSNTTVNQSNRANTNVTANVNAVLKNNGNTNATANANSNSVVQNTNTVTSNTNAATNENVNTSDGITNWEPLFGEQVKSAHFVSSMPAHASVLAASPNEVVLNFNFDLAANSTITVTAANPKSAIARGEDVAAGAVRFDADTLTMRLAINANTTAEKLYAVNYRACWPDGSCHDGRFDFAIDPN